MFSLSLFAGPSFDHCFGTEEEITDSELTWIA
jgi:hypothetical protein